MSSAGVKQVLGQLLADQDFAKSFQLDPSSAMTPFDLTDEEKSSLETFDLSEIGESHMTVSRQLDLSAVRVGLYVT